MLVVKFLTTSPVHIIMYKSFTSLRRRQRKGGLRQSSLPAFALEPSGSVQDGLYFAKVFFWKGLGESFMFQADLLLQNGKIYPVEPAHTRAQAVAVRDGCIFAVGDDSELEPLIGSKTQVINLEGRLVLPGFTDSHTHFLVYALRRHQVVLDGVDDWEEVGCRIRAGVERAALGEWVLGWGWNQNLWGDGTFPSKGDLDDLAPRNPVALTRTDLHSLWVNSLALERASITAETPDPPESRIDRDPATGEPSGILREWGAMRLIEDVIPTPGDDVVDTALQETIAEAHQLGLTGVHDMRVEAERLNALRAFHRLHRRGELTLRVSCALPVDRLDEAIAVGLGSGLGDATLRISGVKVFTDGSMGSSTAWMLEPYADDPDNYGMAVTPKDQLCDVAYRAVQAGLSLIIHAIGDRAIRKVLDVLAEVGENGERRMEDDLRHRIEHVQLIHPDDIPRLAQLGVIASMQPVHVMDDWPVADRVWGHERSRTAYAFRSLLNVGTHLALGSDCPVAPLNPLLGIQAAVLRQNEKGKPEGGWYPQERLTVAEAVRGYTMGAAYAVRLEDVLGSITPGKLADLVVLDRDIFEIEPGEIASVKPTMTIFDGQVVYQA
jgi:predicted amidohydrolase YtcJ